MSIDMAALVGHRVEATDGQLALRPLVEQYDANRHM